MHLVRHGQVENPARVLYGRLPGYVLSETGRAQAQLLGEWFTPVPLAAVLASPLERAQETAAAVAAPHRLQVGTDERLIEAGNLFEGVAGSLPWHLLRHPATWWSLRNPLAPSWGEPNADVAARMQAAVADARQPFQGRHVALVSHQAPIWICRLALEHRRLANRPDRRRCALASVTTLAFDGDRLTGVDYAEPAAGPLLDQAARRAGA